MNNHSYAEHVHCSTELADILGMRSNSGRREAHFWSVILIEVRDVAGRILAARAMAADVPERRFK